MTLSAEFVLSIGVMHVVVRRTVVNGSFSDASIAPWPIMRIAEDIPGYMICGKHENAWKKPTVSSKFLLIH